MTREQKIKFLQEAASGNVSSRYSGPREEMSFTRTSKNRFRCISNEKEFTLEQILELNASYLASGEIEDRWTQGKEYEEYSVMSFGIKPTFMIQTFCPKDEEEPAEILLPPITSS